MKMRGLAVTALAFTTVVSCGAPRERATWNEPSNDLFTAGPYVMLGETGTAFIAVESNDDAAPVVEYRLEGAPNAVKRIAADPSGAGLWVATLSGLPRDQSVAYQVRSARGITETFRFRAGVTAGQSVRFAAFGDTRDGHFVHRSVVDAVAKQHVDFVLNTGDMVARGGLRAQWRQFFRIERPLLASTPVLPAIGNHDMGSGQLFKHYFLHKRWAGDNRYYFQDWGNLRVVAVDSGIECRRGCDQYTFAERSLADGAARGMLMVMFLHHAPYSSGEHGSDERVQEPIASLARRYGVELVLAGHDHDYERTRPIDGTAYIVSGSAGAPIRPVTPQAFTAHIRTEPHYVLVDVEADRLVVRAINLDGNTFDTAVIPALEPRL